MILSLLFSLNKLYRHSFHLNHVEDAEFLELVGPFLHHKEIQNLGNYLQHSDITTLEHVTAVAFLTYHLCRELEWNYQSAAKAALLHDFVTYDWHEKEAWHRFHGFRHPGFAVGNARRITTLTPLEENIIRRHMWPLTPVPPRYKESLLVSCVDKYCATRETMRKYRKTDKKL